MIEILIIYLCGVVVTLTALVSFIIQAEWRDTKVITLSHLLVVIVIPWLSWLSFIIAFFDMIIDRTDRIILIDHRKHPAAGTGPLASRKEGGV